MKNLSLPALWIWVISLNGQGLLGANLQKLSLLFTFLGHFSYRMRWLVLLEVKELFLLPKAPWQHELERFWPLGYYIAIWFKRLSSSSYLGCHHSFWEWYFHYLGDKKGVEKFIRSCKWSRCVIGLGNTNSSFPDYPSFFCLIHADDIIKGLQISGLTSNPSHSVVIVDMLFKTGISFIFHNAKRLRHQTCLASFAI